MSKPTRIALVGATGLIGMSLIRLAVSRADFRVVGIARREAKLPPGARMEMLVADPDNWGDAIAAANADVLVSALGTTWKKAGRDEAAFRAVDHDLVLACGKAAKAAGIRQMITVSSVGADPAARNRYLRVKGEAEQALGRLGLTLGPLDGAGRAKFGIAATAKGVLVTGVDPSGAAAEKYMRAGDVIAEVGGQPVASPGQIAQRLNADVKAGKKVVLFLVRRGDDLTYVGLRFD